VKVLMVLAVLLHGLPTERQLEAPDESVAIDGRLVLTPIMSRASDSPEFAVEFVSQSPEPFTATRIQPRSGIILDGREYTPNVFRWAGIVNTIEPGDTYRFRIALGGYLRGNERREYSKILQRWRWYVPLSSGTHRVSFFLRQHSNIDTQTILSNEVVFDWDDSQPLLYE
jgi:hypothetical protein